VARPKKHWPMVEASGDEAFLAVRLYNDATDIRSFEGFVVHMHLAWLYLLHAEFTRDNIDYRYWQRDNPRRLERIDGEPSSRSLPAVFGSAGRTRETRCAQTSTSSSACATKSNTASYATTLPLRRLSAAKPRRCSSIMRRS
jgi:Protein of unknown function (DUF3644)